MATDDYGYARATEVMNTKTFHDIRWSVKITSRESWIDIGIATKLKQKYDVFGEFDENAIIYESIFGRTGIWRGNNMIYNISDHDPGDEIHFRFQPKSKTFLISMVSSNRLLF